MAGPLAAIPAVLGKAVAAAGTKKGMGAMVAGGVVGASSGASGPKAKASGGMTRLR